MTQKRTWYRLITLLLVPALVYQCGRTPAFGGSEQSPSDSGNNTNAQNIATIYQVTPEQFETIEPLLQAHGFQQMTNKTAIAEGVDSTNQIPTNIVVSPCAVDLAPAPNATGGSIGAPPKHTIPESSQHSETATPSSPCPTSHASNGDLVGDLVVEILDTDWSSRDAAVIIFVVVGLTVVLTVVIYAGVYLYEIITGTGDYTYWYHIQTHVDTILGGSENGFLAGAKFGMGFEQGHMRTGFQLESGYLNMRVKSDGSNKSIRAEGGYLMAGASAQWLFGQPQNPSHLGLELLAGVADDPNVDMLSVARAKLAFGIGSRGRLGLSIGSIMIDLDPEEGFVGNQNSFIPTLGIETGLRF